MNRPASPFGSFTLGDIAAVLAMNIVWGLNTVALKMSVDLIPPFTAAWLRQLMVLIVCVPFLRFVAGSNLQLIGLGALSGAVFYILTNLSFELATNVAGLAIAGLLGVPFTLLLAIWFLKETIYWRRMLGVGMSLTGVAMLSFDPSAIGEPAALMLCVAASAVWAWCSLIQRKLVGVKVMTIYAWIGAMGTVLILPAAWVAEPEAVRNIWALPHEGLAWVAFSALGSTLIGQGLMSYLIQRHPLSAVVPLTLLNPVIGIMAASWWFGTQLTPLTIISGLVVLAGVSIVVLRSAPSMDKDHSHND